MTVPWTAVLLPIVAGVVTGVAGVLLGAAAAAVGVDADGCRVCLTGVLLGRVRMRPRRDVGPMCEQMGDEQQGKACLLLDVSIVGDLPS